MGPVRILWVKANKLLPMHSGGDIRSYHIARHLASRHELCFLSYYDGRPDPAYERQLAEHFSGGCCVSTGGPKSVPTRALDYLFRLLDPAPYAVSRFKSALVREKLDSWFKQKRFDVAVCDFLDAAVNFPFSGSVPTVLFQHNVESEIWRRHAETETNLAKRVIYGMEFSKMLAYEKVTVPQFPHVVAVSEHDRKLMSAWIDPSRVTVVPTGVDLRQYKPDFSTRDLAPLVVFVGAMDWEPNIDAVEYFCKEIWPTVLARIPQAKFRIVGRNPDHRVQRFACSSIEVTGRVPAVIDHLHQAAVVIVPLRIGGGTRLKIYEAMAAGKAMVSTSVGAEGLDVHHGRDIILADSPTAFAESVLMFLGDSDVRRRYECAAAELATHYDWAAVGDRFEEVLESVTGHAPVPRDRQYAGSRSGSATSSRP
jgi:glycosyltransferase involved in cell wall biosynthesis